MGSSSTSARRSLALPVSDTTVRLQLPFRHRTRRGLDVANIQTITVVFTDLVDSTATAESLGPDAAEELRQTHFRLLRSAVAATGGTEVKNLGDGLVVTYSSPSRALVGAVGMQQAIEHYNRSGSQPLSVRIGASAGEAVEEDGDYFGDPVTEAARLCAPPLVDRSWRRTSCGCCSVGTPPRPFAK